MTTPTRTLSAPTAPGRMAGRVAAAAFVLFALCLFGTVAVVNVPASAADAVLLVWWQEPANRSAGTLSSLLAVAAAVLFAVAVNHVVRLPAAAGAAAWLGLARTMAAAVTATLLVSAALRGVIGRLVEQMGQPLPSPDVLRYSTALTYTLVHLSVMTVLALAITAIAVVTLRTAVLPRWTGYVGLIAVVVIVVAVAAQIGAYAIPAALLWSLCLGAVVWPRRRHPEPVESSP